MNIGKITLQGLINNPPVTNHGQHYAAGSTAAPGPMAGSWPATDQERKVQSSQRFRSFAERYLIERLKFIPADADMNAANHKIMLEARSAYNMIREMGRTIADDT